MAAPWSGQPGAVRALWPARSGTWSSRFVSQARSFSAGALYGCSFCLGRVSLDHVPPAAEGELGLNGLLLLAPQRAVVVQRLDPVPGRHTGRAGPGDGLNKLENRALRVALAPAGKQLAAVHDLTSVPPGCQSRANAASAVELPRAVAGPGRDRIFRRCPAFLICCHLATASWPVQPGWPDPEVAGAVGARMPPGMPAFSSPGTVRVVLPRCHRSRSAVSRPEATASRRDWWSRSFWSA
jgi:hypothetical protein